MSRSRYNQVCLITGASSGIGLATAIELVRAGHTVFGAARRINEMEPLRAAGGNPLRMDVTHEGERRNAVQTVLDEYGRIDVLINNAGVAVPGPIEDVPVETARAAFEVNLFGPSELIRLTLPHMRQREGGRIINISSIGGEISLPLAAWYYASKHALEAYSDTLRQEVRRFGIDVVLIRPGIIRTEFERETTSALRAASAAGPYQDIADKFAHQTEKLYSNHTAASYPAVVARTVRDVVEIDKPRTRYSVGYLAKPLLLLNRMLPDRLFDALVTPGS